MINDISINLKFLVISLIIVLISSCKQTPKQLSIDYRINGSNEISISNTNAPGTKTSYFKSGEIKADPSILNNPDLITLKNWKDSISDYKLVNGEDVLVRQSTINSTLSTDTFYLIESTPTFQKYRIKGKTHSRVLSISIQNNDSLQFFINQTFNDTIVINETDKKHAEKMAYHIVQKLLHEDKHDLIRNEEKNIASLTEL